MRLLRSLFLLDEPYQRADGNRHWRISVLRIFLAGNMGLSLALQLHVVYAAWVQGSLLVTVPVLLFFSAAVVMWRLSRRHTTFASALLIVSIYAAATIMMFMVGIMEIRRMGAVFAYLAPMVAWALFGSTVCFALLVFNFLPVAFVLFSAQPPLLFGIDLVMPYSIEYIHVLFFVVFNLGMPLVLLRVRKALDTAAHRHLRTIRRLESSAAMYQEVFENCGSAAVICGPNGKVLRANAQAAELSGRTLEQERPLLQDLLRGESEAQPSWAFLQGQTGKDEFMLECRAGGRYWVKLQATPMTGSRNCFITLRDISSLRRTQRALSESVERAGYLASHDPLTGLNNRQEFIDCLALALGNARKSVQPPFAVIYIRLNNIRQINEKYGIPLGDMTIRNVAQHLACLRERGIKVARLQGLVFALRVADIRDSRSLECWVRDLEDGLPRAMETGGGKIHLAYAIGATLQSGIHDSVPELLRRAERALGEARRQPYAAHALFDEKMTEQVRREIEIELALPTALERGELELHFQPKVRADGTVDSMEALSRWTSLEMGSVPAAEFIYVAEKSGLITSITEYVLERVCAQQAKWWREIGHVLPVAINLSGRDLRREDLAEMFLASIRKHQLESSLIQLEITETALVDNDAIALRQLEELTRCGFRLALDDFGRGFSSLGKLSEFPIATIKVDRSFVTGIGVHHRREQIVKATLSLARALQCESVAEGVETRAQYDFLRAHGCEVFQGFLFYHPLPAEAAGQLLRAEKYRQDGLEAKNAEPPSNVHNLHKK